MKKRGRYNRRVLLSGLGRCPQMPCQGSRSVLLMGYQGKAMLKGMHYLEYLKVLNEAVC